MTDAVSARHHRVELTHVNGLDGLRGLAVIAVVLFHGGISWANGGFLGVELFFVLSGFLITSLLLREWLMSGTVILGQFWARRARRLLPAKIGLQGNLAPALLGDDTLEKVAAETLRLLEVMRGRRGYIFNLSHGVPPNAKLENIAALVETVKNFK